MANHEINYPSYRHSQPTGPYQSLVVSSSPPAVATGVFKGFRLKTFSLWDGEEVESNLIKSRYRINWKFPLGHGTYGRVLEVSNPNRVLTLTLTFF